jgi:hypothetical protein
VRKEDHRNEWLTLVSPANSGAKSWASFGSRSDFPTPSMCWLR